MRRSPEEKRASDRAAKKRKYQDPEYKEILRKRNAEWRQNNREYILAKAKENYEKNKERELARTAAWRQENPERTKANKQRWAEKNRELLAERRALHYQKNIEKAKAAAKKWRLDNPESARQISVRKRARKRGANVGNRQAILEWEATWRASRKVKCFWCERTFSGSECHADHVVPLSRGGDHDVSNLVIACASCNQSKHCVSPEVFNKRSKAPKLFV